MRSPLQPFWKSRPSAINMQKTATVSLEDNTPNVCFTIDNSDSILPRQDRLLLGPYHILILSFLKIFFFLCFNLASMNFLLYRNHLDIHANHDIERRSQQTLHTDPILLTKLLIKLPTTLLIESEYKSETRQNISKCRHENA